MQTASLAYNLLLALVIFLGGQLLGAGLVTPPKQSLPPEGPQLHLRAGAFDPLAQPIEQVLVDASGSQPALRLVQFDGPIQDAWLAALQSCDLERAGYIPDYAYLVWGAAAGVDCLEQAAALRWHGLYLPAYAVHPSLLVSDAGDKPATPVVDVIVQLYETPQTASAVQDILDAALAVMRQPVSHLGYRVMGVRLEQDRLAQIAALPGVVNIEPLPRYARTDEVQGQIMAGNLTQDSSRPSGPGYLAWLTNLGFSNDPNDYPIVDVTDDGIDDGSVLPRHLDFYQFGDQGNPDRLIYNVNWTSDPSAAGIGGHGNLNASIVAGYNNLTGSAYTDDQGYHYGLGINPFGRLAGSKVFSEIWGWNLPNDDFQALLSTTYLNGARISTNSWGSASYGSYTWDDQAYDALVRDALSAEPGNQEIIIIFSAGNNGPSPGSTGSPGNAKNVLTVGAAENYRPTWTDGCGVDPTGANDARDIIDFSSRGPTIDGRIKPDLVAPGTHIQGAASQADGYTGYQVCDAYHPSGQTLYAASSGTSHSTPAVAGAASLFYSYYQEHYSASLPSPAMVKAYLTNSARYLQGLGANDTLPSISQGLGEVFLSRAFDGVGRTLVDQQVRFTESGQVYVIEARITDANHPVRVSLAWSDAPGSPYAAAYVNNLDLEVEINGQTYLGNVFAGPLSTTGGAADAVNNLESVFLPAGQSGSVLVRVRAANIAGDGVPNDGDTTDQDFALVIYNAAQIVGTLRGRVTDQASGSGLQDTILQASNASWHYQTTTDATGVYTLPLLADTYTVEAWKLGYSLEAASAVVITDDQVTTQDFELIQVNSYQLSGCVSDQATGQGLAANVEVSGPFGVPITQTLTTRDDPCYSLELPAAVYWLHVESLLHLAGGAQVDLLADHVQDFALEATTLDGLLRGRVIDYNTAEPLNGIDLLIDPSSVAYPGPYQTSSGEDGAYDILLPADVYTVSTDAPLYAPLQVSGVVVPQSNIEERDFALRSPHIALDPSEPLRFDLQAGEQASGLLRLSNTGSAPLDFLIYESSGDPSSGGPDPAGYLIHDSRVSRAARYQWIDASDGAMLALGDDDEVSVVLPFAFTYYGLTSDILRIGNNGAALFGSADGNISYLNQALSFAPNYLIAPLWDDLDADYGWVAYKTVGLAPERRFVVEWFERPHYSYGSSGVTFELILYESSNNLKFQYQDVIFDDYYANYGHSATVGIRGQGSSYLEYAYDAPKLVNDMALCFQALGALPCDVEDIAWLTFTPSSGSINEQESLFVTVQVDADLAGLGMRLAYLRLWGNDPLHQPYIDIPIRLVVHGFDLFFPTIFMSPPLYSP